jgi:hypothetical protein
MEGNRTDKSEPELTEEAATESLDTTDRHKPSLRGHMILDTDDPLPMADTPAAPPPIDPISPGSQPLQGG